MIPSFCNISVTSTLLVTLPLIGVFVIDWISAILPVNTSIPGGVAITLSPDGEIEQEKVLGMGVGGSFEDTVRVCNIWSSRSQRGKPLPVGFSVIATSVYISGNPAKYLQGHNIYGTDKLPELASLFFRTVAKNLGLDVFTQDLWSNIGRTGDYELTRLDITYNYRVDGGNDEVNEWIRTAHNSARVSHKNVSPLKGNTLYFGKHSRRHTIKIYNKYQDLQAHPISRILMDINVLSVENYIQEDIAIPQAVNGTRCDLNTLLQVNGNTYGLIVDSMVKDSIGLIRVEQCFRGKKLREMGFETAQCLGEKEVMQMFKDGMKGFNITSQVPVNGISKETVGRGAYMFYLEWVTGNLDCSQHNRQTVYNNRKKLLPYGIDITLPCCEGNKVVTVPLIRTIEAVPVSPPSFYYTYGLLAAA